MTEEEENYNMIFKIVLVGDSGVGKTNLLLRYLKNEFNTQTKATVGVEFGNTKVKIDNALIKAQIWDTAGQERYRSITSAYYKGAHGALIVYDITRKDSFDSVEKWLSDLKNNGEEKMVIIKDLKDYIVAEKNGRLLICPIADEQDIKEYSADKQS